MEAKAVARTIRIAPRKVRLVLDLIRGKNVAEAIAILKLTNKASSPVIEKVLMSALANAEHNYDMNTDELVVKEAYANEGPTLILWVKKLIQSDFVLVLSVIGKLNGMLKKTSLHFYTKI